MDKALQRAISHRNGAQLAFWALAATGTGGLGAALFIKQIPRPLSIALAVIGAVSAFIATQVSNHIDRKIKVLANKIAGQEQDKQLEDSIAKEKEPVEKIKFSDLCKRLKNPINDPVEPNLSSDTCRGDPFYDFIRKHAKNLISFHEWSSLYTEFLTSQINLIAKENIPKGSDFSTHKTFTFQQFQICGGINGDVELLINFLKNLSVEPDFTLPKEAPCLVFLPNSRSPNSPFYFEISYMLMALALKNPDKVILLKGNLSIANTAFINGSTRVANNRPQKKIGKYLKKLEAVLPAIFIAQKNEKLTLVAHSMDLRAKPNLSLAGYQPIAYEDFPFLEDKTLCPAMAKRLCKVPEGLVPNSYCGVTVSHIRFVKEDLLKEVSHRVGSISLKMLELVKQGWENHNSVDVMIFGYSKADVSEDKLCDHFEDANSTTVQLLPSFAYVCEF